MPWRNPWHCFFVLIPTIFSSSLASHFSPLAVSQEAVENSTMKLSRTAEDRGTIVGASLTCSDADPCSSPDQCTYRVKYFIQDRALTLTQEDRKAYCEAPGSTVPVWYDPARPEDAVADVRDEGLESGLWRHRFTLALGHMAGGMIVLAMVGFALTRYVVPVATVASWLARRQEGRHRSR